MILALGLGISTAASAQSSILSSILGNENTSGLNSLLETITGTITSKLDLSVEGTWKYSETEVQFKSDNLLTKAGGSLALSSVESTITKIFGKLGIDGSWTFTFQSDNSFTQTAVIAGKTINLKGTYALDNENNTISLSYQALGKVNLGTVNAIYANTGTSLSILFDAHIFYDLLKKIVSAASSFSSSAIVSTLSAVVDKYDGMLLGFKMTR